MSQEMPHEMSSDEAVESKGHRSMFRHVQVAGSWNERDLTEGQPVIIAVRWVMIATGLILAIWNVTDMGELRLQIVALLLLALTNFYLQAQLLMKRQVNPLIVYGASAMDMLMISVLVLYQGGYDSSIFIFYLPAIAAFAVAFPRRLTAMYTAAVVAAYGLIAVGTYEHETNIVVVRLIMIAAVATCGSAYLQLEHDRRSQSMADENALLESLGVAGAE